jgi:hypothetical protein
MLQKRWKRWALGTFLVVVILVLALDVTLRLAFGFGHPLLYANDSDTGYLPAPSQQVDRFGCHNDINSFSMRSPEVFSPKPAGEFRILMIGDSITYGTTYVDQPEIFTSILQRDLPGRLHRSVEVLNASAGGWAPANELGYLRSRGTFHADTVIFVLNTGDLTQPFSQSLVGLSPSFPSEDPYCALTEIWSRYAKPRLMHITVADAGSKAEKPNIPRDTPANLQILGKARSFATDARADFAIVYVPFNGPDWAAYAPGLAMLKDWCKTQHIDLVDTTSALAKYPPEQTAFENGHGHLRPAGHAIVASVIADYLSAHPSTVPATN